MEANSLAPKLRFKDEDGNDYPDWEEKRLEDVFSFISTNSITRDSLNYDKVNVRNIHYGDIITKFQSVFCLENENVPYINKNVDLARYKEYNYCRIGDLIIADASEDYEAIGSLIEIKSLNNEKILAGLHTIHARPESNTFFVGFNAFMMNSWSVKYQIMIIAQGAKVLGISAKRLAKLKLNLPSLNEQQKIASFLTSVDKKIELVDFQLERNKEFKKGLLQQMFV